MEEKLQVNKAHIFIYLLLEIKDNIQDIQKDNSKDWFTLQ